MITGDLSGSVRKLRDLSSSLNIKGQTKEQVLMLAIIDTIEELAEAIIPGNCTGEFLNEQSVAEALLSKCPTCGDEIHLNVSSLQSDEPMVCASCHEVIGILSGSM